MSESQSFASDKKVLASNFLALSLVKVTDYLIPLITLPYLARVLGVDKFGVISFSQAFIQYFICFVEYGFNFSGTRAVALNRQDHAALESILSRIFFAKLFLALCSLALLLLLITVVPPLRKYALLHLFTFGLVFGEVFIPLWFFQGIEQMKYVTIFNCLSKVLFATAIFIFVRQPDDYLIVNLMYGVGAILSGSTAMALLRFKFGLRITLPPWRAVATELRQSFNIFVGTFIPTLYNNTSTFILGLTASETFVGYYAAAIKVINIVNQFVWVLGRVFFPFLNRRFSAFRTAGRIMLGAGLGLTLAVFLSADLLVDILFTNRYEATATLLRILSASSFLLAVMSTYGSNYLVVLKQDRLYMIITATASLIGFAAAIVTIPVWYHYGAAWTLVGARALLALLCFIFAMRLMLDTRRASAG
ncbi:MAG TPA: oligosaccharide flippase family protein [bacterium]|nr:oligosaccharide flippase family protein [bacterium]